MCKDFKKNMKENILVESEFKKRLPSSIAFFLGSSAFILQKQRTLNITKRVKRATNRFWIKVVNANFSLSFLYLYKTGEKTKIIKQRVSNSPALIERLKKLSSEGNEETKELIKNIKNEGQNLVNNI